MSESDSFIEEVTEEVRRDKLFGYVKKYGWIAVVVVFGAVGTTAYLEWQKSQQMAAAQELGDRILAATDQDDAEKRALALGEIGGDAGAAQVLVSLRQAAEVAASGDKDGALVLLDQVASTAPTALYRDLAALKAIMLRGKDMPSTARSQALAGLAQPGQAFRPLAMEQQAIMAMETGDNDTALGILKDVFLDSQATEALRGRVQQMIVALGGEVPPSSQLQLDQ